MFPVKVLIGIGMFAISPNFAGADCPDLDRAKELLRLAEFKEAASLTEKLVSVCPHSSDAVFLAGFSNFLLGNQRKARTYLSSALKLNADHQEASFWLQVSRQERKLRSISDVASRNHFDTAARLLDRYLSEAQTDRYWRSFLNVTVPAELLRVHFYPRLALEFAEKGDFKRAEQMVEIWRAEFPEIGPLASGLQSDLAMKAGDLGSATSLLEEFLRAACSESGEIPWYPTEMFQEAAARLKVPNLIRRPTPSFSLSDVFQTYTREFSFLLKVTEEGAVEHVVLISRPVGHGMEMGAIRSIHENWLFHPAECANGVKKAMWVPVKMEFYPPR